MNLKSKIAANFSASAARYDQYAVMQQQAALSLVRRLTELGPEVLPGPVLELGCGTGAVSRELVSLFPGRRLTLVDLAPGMIDINRQALAPLLESPHLVEWRVQDAETIEARNHYALIASCLTLQWFQDLNASLARLCEALIPGGVLLCSYLGDNSFPEWRGVCQALGLPCIMNPLPGHREVVAAVRGMGGEVSTWDDMIRMTFPSALDFFRSFKKTGTNTNAAEQRLTRLQMARLLAAWPGHGHGAVTVTYQINTIQVRA